MSPKWSGVKSKMFALVIVIVLILLIFLIFFNQKIVLKPSKREFPNETNTTRVKKIIEPLIEENRNDGMFGDYFSVLNFSNNTFGLNAKSCNYNLLNEFVCPCCGFCAVKSEYNDYRGRKEVYCPKCNSLERHRDICAFIGSNFINNEFNRKNFFLGIFGPTPLVSKRLLKINFTSFKFEDYDYNPGQYGNIKVKKIDLQNTNLNSELFNGIITFHVLEHLDIYMKGIKEIHRILKNDGWVLVEVPCNTNLLASLEHVFCTPGVSKGACSNPRHKVFFNCEKLYEEFEEVGFECLRMKYKLGISYGVEETVNQNRPAQRLCFKK